jgi:hypothetical protein
MEDTIVLEVDLVLAYFSYVFRGISGMDLSILRSIILTTNTIRYQK